MIGKNQFPKITYEFVKRLFEIEGYTLLSTEYKNSRKHLEFICPNKHQHKIRWNNWQSGQRCGRCFGNIEVTYEQVKTLFELNGYTLLSTMYVNAFELLEFICPLGHQHKIKWNDWQQGIRCGKCKIDGASKPEKEIREWISNNYQNIIMKFNDRTLIQNPRTGEFLELDIWMPELKKAIEYGAEHWHNDDYTKWKDSYKQQWCRDNGVELLVINEKYWIKNKDFNMIREFINS